MKILAFEFSTVRRSVALICDDLLAAREDFGPHPNPIFPLIRDLLGPIKPAELDRVALNLGPGSYTGLRLAISFAQGLALAHPLQITGFTTFQILLKQLAGSPLMTKFHLVLDAQKNEFLVASYAQSSAGLQETPCRILSRDDLVLKADAGERLIGPGIAQWFPDGLDVWPHARVVAELALHPTKYFLPAELEPFYGREMSFVKMPSAQPTGGTP